MSQKIYFFSDEIPSFFNFLPRKILPYVQLSRPHHLMAGVIPCLCGIQFSNNATNLLYWYTIFTLGAFLILGAGTTINDILDRNIDAKYVKTMTRPLPSGRAKLQPVVVYFLIQLCLAFLIWLQLPNMVKLLSLLELMLICLYPLMKRFSKITQIYLGLIDAFPTLFPYYIYEHKISLGAVFFMLGCAMTCIIFDTTFEYAEYFNNKKIQIKSIANLFKNYAKQYLFFCIFLHVLFMFLAGILENKNLPYFTLSSLSGLFMLRIINLTNFKNPQECWQNFLKLQWANVIILCAVAGDAGASGWLFSQK